MSSVILQRQDTGARWAIDAVPSFNVTRSWRPTEAPVEADSTRPAGTITDHVQTMPLSVSLDCTVTETPTRDDGQGVGPERLAAFLDWMQDAAGRLLTLHLPDRSPVRNLVIVTLPDDGDLYRHVRARIGLASITIVSSSSVQLPDLRRPKPAASAGLASTSDKGSGATKPLSQSERQSVLAGLIRSVVGGGQ